MVTSFPQYVSIKDKYCCLYLGDSSEYVVTLKLITPQIKKHFPKMSFFISCNENLSYLLNNEDNFISFGELAKKKTEFAYIREMKNNYNKHSLMEFIEESFELKPICNTSEDKKGLCLICPEGLPPVKPMKQDVIDKYKQKATMEGHIPLIIGSDIHKTISNINLRPSKTDKLNYILESKCVIGVENEYTILAASQGKKVYLDGSGLGATLYKKMFPKIELI
jgi:hypothetical protein